MLDSYNSTKDSLFNTQTYLGDPRIETSKGEHIRANRAEKNGVGEGEYKDRTTDTVQNSYILKRGNSSEG